MTFRSDIFDVPFFLLGQFDPHHSVSSHFTQVVWKSTTELGCAVSTCGHIFPDQGPAVLYVCLYSPAGNVLGEIAYAISHSKSDRNSTHGHIVDKMSNNQSYLAGYLTFLANFISILEHDIA